MKILQIMTELGFGGAERVVLELCRALTARGDTVYLAVMKDLPEANMRQEFVKLGIYPDILKLNSFRDFRKIGKLRKLIREYQPDVIHSHLMHPNLITRIANLRTGIPLINTVHISERRGRQNLFFLLDSMTNGLCTRYTAVSDASARFHERKIHLQKGTIRTIRNGVDPAAECSQEELDSARERWQVSMCSRLLGAVGRLNQQKGFDRLLRVLRTLEKRIPEKETWGVVILGEGPDRQILEDMARSFPHRKLIIKFPGFEPEAAALAKAFDVFLMPSRYEGYGLVLAEAINLGLPCVYQPVDSLPELADGISYAFPARFDDPEADQQTVETILDAAKLPHSEPKTLFSVAEMTAQYVELYQEVIQK